MDPEIIEQLNEQFREMSEILSQQNSLMAAQVRNLQAMSNGTNKATNATNNNTSATDRNTRATDNLSDSQTRATSTLDKFNSGVDFTARAIIGLGKTVMDSDRNFQKYGSAVAAIGDKALEWGRQLGPLGSVFGGIAKASSTLIEYQLTQADGILKFGDTVSKLGAMNTFSSQELLKMGNQAGFAAKDFEKLTAPLQKLGSNFKIIGDGAADSTKKFMEMTAVSTETRQEFQRLGYSQEQLVEAQAGYIELLGSAGLAIRNFSGDVHSLRKNSLEYIKNLQILSELSGQTAEEQQKEAERAAADMQFQLYLADMNKKIAEASTQEEKDKLTEQVQLALFTKSRIAALLGEDAARGYGQQIAGGPQTLGLAEGVITGSQEEIDRLAQLTKENKLTIEDLAKSQDQMAQNTRDVVNGPLRQALIVSDETGKLVGGLNAVFTANKLTGLSTEERVEDLKKKFKDNEEDKGPVAEDNLYKARNKLTESEIALSTSFDNLAFEVGGAVPIMNKFSDALNYATGILKTFGPRAAGLNEYGGAATVLVGALAGIAGLGIFKGAKAGLSSLRSRETVTTTKSILTSTSPASSNIPRTPTIITDGGKTYTRTQGGVLLPQGMDIPDINTKTTKATKPSMLSRLSGSGKYLGRLGGGIGGALGGLALNAGADMAAEAGYTKTSGMLSAGSYAATGAGLGAMFGPIGALVGGLAGGAYGLYQNWDIITGKKKPQISQQELQTPSIANIDTSFNSAVISFGRMVTSFGKIVTAYSKTTIGFITATKKIEKSLDGLGQLSAINKGKKHDTINVTEFNKTIARFSDILSSFSKITSITKKTEIANNKLLGNFVKEEEEDSLVDYIKNLKTEFRLTSEATSFMRDEEIKRHNFNEMSMLKFRQSLEDLTNKFKELTKVVSLSDKNSEDNSDNSDNSQGFATSGTGSSANAQKAMDYFIQQGWSKEQAAGIVGNLQQESGRDLDHKAKNATGHYGLAQWDTARRKEFERVMGKSIYDSSFEEQLAFIQYELTSGKEKRAGEKLRSARTAAEAATIFERTYERANGHALEKRVANAERLTRGETPFQQTAASKAIAEFGRTLMREFGVKVGRHSAFNPGGKLTTSGHSANSQHYKDLAIDINAPEGGVKEWESKKWRKKFDQIAAIARQQGYQVYWGDEDHRDHLHVEVPKVRAAQGGVFDGPSSGYPAELHGSEMVAPLDTNSILMKLATTPASATVGDITASTSKIEKEIIEKISTTNLETMQALLDKFDSLINAIEEGNSVRDKMYKSSMI